MKKFLFFFLATVFTVSTLNAQKPAVVMSKKSGWHKISTADVNFKTDKDEFKILGADHFKALRVKVFDAPVRIESMTVQYEGGTTETLALNSDFKAGGKSKVF